MTVEFPTALILILGAAGVPFLKGKARSVYVLLLPVLAFVHVLAIPEGDYGRYTLAGQELVAMRVDRLSMLFAYVFLLAAFLCAIYALHVKDTVQHVAALVYAGSALGAIFAGDLITMFVFWEISAVASVLLIWASRTERAFRAGMWPGRIHRLAPVGEISVSHQQADRGSERLPQAHAPGDLDAIVLDPHAAATTVAGHAALQIPVDPLRIDGNAGGKPLDDHGQCRTVRLPRGQET